MNNNLTYDNIMSFEDFGKCITCPVCNDFYVHFEKPNFIYSEDKVGIAWQGRGDAIKISFWCEQDHHWILRFGFHKGLTYLKIENKEENCKYCGKLVRKVDDDGSILWNCATCGAKYLH